MYAPSQLCYLVKTTVDWEILMLKNFFTKFFVAVNYHIYVQLQKLFYVI